jgi:hypothetical protein
MFIFHQQNARRSRRTEVANEFFDGMGKFKYLGTAQANQIYLHKEDKSRLDSAPNFFTFLSVVCLKA